MTSIKEIALVAGFSQSTVSRLLNHDETLSVSESTRIKILETAKKLHYPLRPQELKKKYKIAVFFSLNPQHEIEDVYYYDLRRCIVEYANQEYIDITFMNNPNTTDAKDYDGALAVGYFDTLQLQQLHQNFSHIIFIDGNPDPEYFSSVQPDLEYATTKAVNLFINRNFTDIGIVTGQYWSTNIPNNQVIRLDSRLNYFRNIMTDAALYNADLLFQAHDFTMSSGLAVGRIIGNAMQNGLSLNALFISSDSLAIGVLNALNEIDANLAQKLAIISINDSASAAYTQPALTTFHIDMQQLVTAGFDKLDDMISFNRTMQTTTLITPTLIYRDSFKKHE
ncbi:LacI family DNA-binding transcriptional regulator [Weissella paramesenteroides]|uniref:LacI family DNA-binding transcriptional regulator n=1 Tax=Weissella paramesenteroides TaxID=1249 RepID=UPI0024028332|nr:LacI family DNA-binding transcriptional regulator [Weissella paramesenteroides]MDF8366799.1 LacI family transcriptional regulator [Weissella paramesenteroides]